MSMADFRGAYTGAIRPLDENEAAIVGPVKRLREVVPEFVEDTRLNMLQAVLGGGK